MTTTERNRTVTDPKADPETSPAPEPAKPRRRAATKAAPTEAPAPAPEPAAPPRVAGLPVHDGAVALPDGRTMPVAEYVERAALLVAPFPVDQVEKLPKPLGRSEDRYQCQPGTQASADGYHCGGYHVRSIHLDYVGHAGITARLLEADPLWDWDFMLKGPHGEPVYTDGGLWITLTVLGITRKGFGDAGGKHGPNAIKELIGDALRNAAMRHGVATYLWSKSTASAVLRAGGSPDDTPAQDRPQRPAAGSPGRSARQGANASQRPATTPPQDTPAPTDEQRAVARRLRDEVIGAADGFEPGPARDAILRPLHDRALEANVLTVPVELPEAWDQSGEVTIALAGLIGGARRVAIPSGERPATEAPPADDQPAAANMDDDPWATPAPTDDYPTDEGH